MNSPFQSGRGRGQRGAVFAGPEQPRPVPQEPRLHALRCSGQKSS